MESFHKKEFSIAKLKHWFQKEKRNFPWRENPTPYVVWISEVMLQQTRSSVVVSYFLRWMKQFPDIPTLANAPIDKVIKAWEGLGYYSRARNLHEGAKYLLKNHGGNLPSESQALKRVKGLGPYTIGAIQSFAFHQKAPAIDGNVIRVASRLFLLEEEIHRTSMKKLLNQKIEEFLPDNEPWIVMEALIELGATVCSSNPTCEMCPLKEDCLGFQLGKVDQLPRKKKPVSITVLKRKVFLISFENEFLVQRHRGKKVMADLYEFPYAEANTFENFYPSPLSFKHSFKEIIQTFTRYRAHLFPKLYTAKKKMEISGYEWVKINLLSKLPFSSGHKKILKELLEEYAHLTY